MIKLLDEIQKDLAQLTTDIKAGDTDSALNDIHYLHAYIESRKKDFQAEAVLEQRELVTA